MINHLTQSATFWMIVIRIHNASFEVKGAERPEKRFSGGVEEFFQYFIGFSEFWKKFLRFENSSLGFWRSDSSSLGF